MRRAGGAVEEERGGRAADRAEAVRRRRRGAAWLVIAVVAVSSCAADDGVVSTVVPGQNRCSVTSDCGAIAGAVCDAATQLCRQPEPTGLDVTYVVSFPSTAFPLAGKTVTISRKTLLGCRPLPRSCSQPGTCVCISEVRSGTRSVADAYRITGDAAEALGLSLGKGRMSLPARAVFRPLSPIGPTGLLAAAARVPLDVLVADMAGEDDARDQPAGPFGTPPQGFLATLPGGRYLRSLDPLPPFDVSVPPVTGVVEVGVDAMGSTVEAVKEWTFVLESLEPIEGYRLFFRDRGSGLRVSNVFSPRFGRNEVRLFTVGYADLTQTPVDIVVEAPADSGRASLVSPVFIVPGTERMPRLPVAERVAGSVIGNPEGVPLAAKLLFRSAVDQDDISQLEPINSKLRYSAEVSSTHDGRYEVRLPPGRYDVAVVPTLESGFAASVRSLLLPSGGGGDGRGFSLPRLRRLQGSVTIPGVVEGRRPLVGALVRARPSVTPLPVGAFPSLARTRETSTDASGFYSLDVDPGLYDVVVEPASQVRWPTTTILGVDVPVPTEGFLDDAVRLPPLELGAPLDLGFTLVNERSGRVVSGAVVRAFAVSAERSVPVELGRGTTDRAGRVDIFATLPR